MGQILVWESETDGKLFRTERNYNKHMTALRKAKEAADDLQHRINQHQALFTTMRATCKSLAEISQFIRDNWQDFYINGQTRNMRWGQPMIDGLGTPSCVELLHSVWDERARNTHSCPIGGEQNFTWKDGAIRGYPGWRCSVFINYPVEKNYLGHGLFEGTGINTGSGGGSWKALRYDVILYAHDWPAMYEQEMREQWVRQENAERKNMWRILNGQTRADWDTGAGSIVTIEDMPDDWKVPALGPLRHNKEKEMA